MDGGETDGMGYFGWVIATECSIIVETKEHTSGAQHLMESLCTDSTSILLLLCFLLYSSRFHKL
eukprot:12529685-Ditylum_brightwellii.AAC.1